MAMAQPTAMSAALPVASWCTAKEQLMPAPFTSLPCSYSRRTDGPMPCQAAEVCQHDCAPSCCAYLMLHSEERHMLPSHAVMLVFTECWMQTRQEAHGSGS